jgi:2-isopropylmalate synthase
LVREVLGDRPRYFRLEAWRSNISTLPGGAAAGDTFSEATVKLFAGGRRLVRVGEGVGPVDALDQALRTALKNVYPDLTRIELIDFKVRILDTHQGTAATTRVLIELSDGQRTWRTVGIGADVVEASWEALTEGYEFGLMRAGIEPHPEGPEGSD